MPNQILKGKKILVTAGSTWVPIDKVRVITNIFKGSIGLTIAQEAAELGAEVLLLLGPSFDLSKTHFPNNLNIVRFKYFDELDSLVTQNLRKTKFDAVIHSAAVSDFQLSKTHDGKIKSNTDRLLLELIPTKKIVDGIKSLSPSVFLVKFKLEVGVTDEQLKHIAFDSLKQSNADLIVANVYNPNFTDHEAFIINACDKCDKVKGRKNIAATILNEIHDKC
jgi:phosphopantothenoylcysteine synthetase/decarboxylase